MCIWVDVEHTYPHHTTIVPCRNKHELQHALGVDLIPVSMDQWDKRHGEWWSDHCCLCNCDLAATALQAGMLVTKQEYPSNEYRIHRPQQERMF